MAIRTCNVVLATCNKIFVRQGERKIVTCNSREVMFNEMGWKKNRLFKNQSCFLVLFFHTFFLLAGYLTIRL